ncbi:MAG: NAD-dependent deacylase [Phycisphaerales bacterium]|jgi:NAD-dependent deacetylase
MTIDADGTDLNAVAGLVRDARRIAVLTGAGVSAESGIETFRQPQTGLWARYDPMELASIGALERDPEMVTQWYHWRFSKCADAKPNAGHESLARLQSIKRERGGDVDVITQNIDGLHQAGGAKDVIELHGSILRWRCQDTGSTRPIEEVDFSRFPPRSEAGGVLRPDIVLFGEMLPTEAIEAAERAVMSCDLFLTIGTSAVVYPAAGYIDLAISRGVPSIEINPDATPMTGSVTHALRGASGVVLLELLRRSGVERA